LGKGCAAPDNKCERDRYKHLLAQAVRPAGVVPLLGGLEHTEALVQGMDLDRLQTRDLSLGKLLAALLEKFVQWKVT